MMNGVVKVQNKDTTHNKLEVTGDEGWEIYNVDHDTGRIVFLK